MKQSYNAHDYDYKGAFTPDPHARLVTNRECISSVLSTTRWSVAPSDDALETCVDWGGGGKTGQRGAHPFVVRFRRCVRKMGSSVLSARGKCFFTLEL